VPERVHKRLSASLFADLFDWRDIHACPHSRNWFVVLERAFTGGLTPH
jgi:hypothetical protein